MENLQDNTAQIYTNATKVSIIRQQPLASIGSWLFGFLTVSLFIFCSLFTYQKFFKVPDTIIFSREVKNTLPQTLTDKMTIKKGTTIGKILSSYGLSHEEIRNILKISALKKVNLEHLKPKQALKIQYTTDNSQKKILKYFTITTSKTSKLEITRDEKTNDFKASILPINLAREIITFENKIQSSLISSALRTGVPMQNLIEATNACSYEIDFQRDIRKGNSFKILVEKFTSPEDGSTFFGKTLYFSLNLKNKQYKIYKFKPQNGKEEFFTEKYQSAKRGLLKTPVPVFRISSKFGKRKHPILGYSVMHKGVDFAAPRNTPIYAAGDGVVSFIGRGTGYGKYIKIRHNNKLTTLYAHINKFTKKLKKGMRVKQGQTIASVGMTGRATGPHLHYEIHVNGRHVNPLRFKLPSMKVLKGNDIEAFKNHKSYINTLLNPVVN
ncbi:MAG: peptidoglycan DD-metalloendopeptidase family protein [Rickettsiales bacterium]|nr:peptidoglycan DD-metalloendopeptidase family protein [Rickettsiales bacterium]